MMEAKIMMTLFQNGTRIPGMKHHCHHTGQLRQTIAHTVRRLVVGR